MSWRMPTETARHERTWMAFPAEGETLGVTVGGITVPRYYWMAILAQRGDHYQAIAFWVEHTRPAKVDRPRTVAISIDQLEKRTGLDFFYNLPDNIETRVDRLLPPAEHRRNVYRWTGGAAGALPRYRGGGPCTHALPLSTHNPPLSTREWLTSAMK